MLDSDEALPAGADTPVRTGNDAVDDVLQSLEQLPELALEDHVGVFEGAHEQLRAALDGLRD